MDTRLQEEKDAWLKDKRPRENGGSHQEKKHFKQSGFWGRRTTLEKLLLFLVIFILIAFIIVVVVVVVSNEESEEDVCLTKECVSAAARISNNIDYSVHPCDDFYQFSCGRWMKENVIPEDKSSYSTFSILRDRVDVVLKNLLEQDIRENDIEAVKKAKTLYASCMNTDAIEERRDVPLKTLLRQFGGWPIITPDWNESAFNLEDAMQELNLHSTYPIITFFVGVDNKNSTQRVLKLDQPSFDMPGQKYYLVSRDDKILMAYENFMYGVGKLMGFANETSSRQEIKEIVDFEIQLANISVPDEDRRDNNKLYNPMTLRDLHNNYSNYFNWRKFILNVTGSKGIDIHDVTDDEMIINISPLYYERLAEVLLNTPKRVVANYAMWRLTSSLISTLTDDYKELLLAYHKVLWGTSTEKPRFRRCIGYTTVNLGLAVGNMFIKENFQAEAKAMAMEMIEGLHESFNSLLTDLDWMDETTKKVAKEKNEHISPKIGYPDEVTNITYLNEYYSSYSYTDDEYFNNVITNRKENYRIYFKELRKPVDKEKWESPPSTVNAFYSAQKNQILFPAGILQKPFFSQTYPKSLNFGGIGVVIGHEITHGFDDRGRQYDKYGNLVQWWSNSAIEKFKTRAQCVVDQYGNFTVAEIDKNLNGVNTQGENIADNGGLKQAYDAYRNWVTKRGKEEPTLPGLGFTHNQLFFVNFAQLWCNLMREGSALSSVRTGVHSPGRFRVIGSAQNSDEFAEAFNCPKNSYMNPTKKCRVW